VRTLKTIIKKLHAGEAADTVKSALAEIVRATDSADIAVRGSVLSMRQNDGGDLRSAERCARR
jgi:ribosomal protein S20